ncbi:hypothetical protein AVT97_gp08 [Sulfolobales Virus YNP2]|uniref:hypothetical protein n=1 Tax=Sulfolobales Virus YNP2 TaxID=1732180 RepID=UPI0007064456|nr:hypothetical protein AVT97_gp08 [Sulfolobales Virus YNP2]ALG97171.1 hypothetical protein [Sulfolobales Virus YNP2]
MNILDVITAYNPLFSPEKENVIMVPLEYVDEVRELAKSYNATIQVFSRRKSKFVYIRWSPHKDNKKR